MNRIIFFLAGIAAMLLHAGLAMAQSGSGVVSEQGLTDEHPFSRAYMERERFSIAPKIGERLPNITIFDDRGHPVNLREVAQGHYTVLVLGCLT